MNNKFRKDNSVDEYVDKYMHDHFPMIGDYTANEIINLCNKYLKDRSFKNKEKLLEASIKKAIRYAYITNKKNSGTDIDELVGASIEWLNKYIDEYNDVATNFNKSINARLSSHLNTDGILTQSSLTKNSIDDYENITTYDSISENMDIEYLNRKVLSFMEGNLNPRDKEIMMYRYGFIDGKFRSLDELANMFNLTRQRIRQIDAKSIRQLKIYFGRDKDLNEYLSDVIRRQKGTDINSYNNFNAEDDLDETDEIEHSL